MADIAAPFLTPEQLIGMPGDPALGGGAINYDPSNKAPFQPLQETFTRLDTENNAAIQAKQRQQAQFQHDTMSKLMDFDHADKVMQYKQRIDDRNELFKILHQNKMSAFNQKDENGNDVSMTPLEQDDDYLNKSVNDFRKKWMNNPTQAFNSPEFQSDMDKQDRLKTIASMRKIQTAKLQQELSQTADPNEQQRIQQVIDGIKNTPLSALKMPDAHLPGPVVKPFIDVEKDYKEGKGFESFDDGEGVPNRRFQSILYSTDKDMLNQAYIRQQALLKSQLPEATNPEAFQAWQQNVNNLTDQRGFPKLNLGTVTPDGKVVLNQDPRVVATALELQKSGALTKPDELEVAKTTEQKAKARKEEAEAALKETELRTGKSLKPTTEELKQEQDKKAVASIATEVKDVFTNGTAPKPISVQYPDFWKRSGIDPEEYKIYPAISDKTADKFIGLPHPDVSTTQKDASGNSVTQKSTIASVVPDKVVPVENIKTHEKKLVYFKDNQVVATVPEKQAIINGLKHEADYDPKVYENKTAWVDEVHANEKQATETSKEKTNVKQPAVQVTIPNTIAATDRIVENGKKIAVFNGKKHEIIGKDKKGNLIGIPIE